MCLILPGGLGDLLGALGDIFQHGLTVAIVVAVEAAEEIWLAGVSHHFLEEASVG